MTHSFRYILKTLCVTTAMVVTVFIAIELFIGFSNELVDVGTSHYGFIQALVYVILCLPMNLYSLFPIILLISSLLGWGRLSQSSELIIFQMSGMSLLRLAGYIFMYSLLIGTIFFSIGECLGPYAYNRAIVYKDTELNNILPSHSIHNIWLKKNDDYYFIRQISSDHKVSNMTDFHFKGKQLQSVIAAKSVIRGPDGWVWNNVNQLTVSANKVKRIHKKSMILAAPHINYHLLEAYQSNISAVDLLALHHLIHYLYLNNINNTAESYMFWHRIFVPFIAFMMALLALPFMIGSFRVLSMFARITFGLTLGLFYYLVSQMVSSLSVLVTVSPFWMAVAPIVFFCICYAILMSRTHN